MVAYLTKNFGPDSDLPRSPADLPEYASVKQEFGDAGMRINYVTFEMPGSNRFPGAATPERDGKVYIWTYNQHRFAILDPKTAKVTEYLIPGVDQASNHSTRLGLRTARLVHRTSAERDRKLDPTTAKSPPTRTMFRDAATPWWSTPRVRSTPPASRSRNSIPRLRNSRITPKCRPPTA